MFRHPVRQTRIGFSARVLCSTQTLCAPLQEFARWPVSLCHPYSGRAGPEAFGPGLFLVVASGTISRDSSLCSNPPAGNTTWTRTCLRRRAAEEDDHLFTPVGVHCRYSAVRSLTRQSRCFHLTPIVIGTRLGFRLANEHSSVTCFFFAWRLNCTGTITLDLRLCPPRSTMPRLELHAMQPRGGTA